MGFFHNLLHPGPDVSPLPAKPSPLDIVIYTASLASNPKQIDVILDPIRIITSGANTKDFTAEQQASVTNVYLQLEDYLVTKEPLRKFTRDGLRSRLPQQFTATLNKEQASA